MTQASESGLFIYFLIATALTCGAMVMVVEVLGSKVIGPIFGVSLFVWTSLITVTLIALAVGYAMGGYFSDRKASPDYLYGIILAAGLLVLIIPFVKSGVLKSFQPLGLRMGALASATVLFGPSLFLLGCVSPYLIKVSAKELRNIGRTVGIFYSISTAGSFIGTVATGFFLIAYLGVSTIFNVVGSILIALSLLYFIVFRKKWLFLCVILLPLLLFPTEGLKSITLPNGIRIAELYNKDTFYGNMKVVEMNYEITRYRELLIDGQVQGGIDMNNGLSLYAYQYFLEFLPYALHPAGNRCLVIGLGAGIIPSWYETMEIRTDVLDISKDVVDIARTYFGFDNSGSVFVEDARYFLNSTKERYDYIILDVSRGDTTPSHIMSRESFKLVKKTLVDGGIMGLNLAGSLKYETFMTASVIKTIEEEFKYVRAYPLFVPEKGDGIGNVIVIASDAPLPPLDITVFDRYKVHPEVRMKMNSYLGSTFRFPPETKSIILTDEYNPADLYELWYKEKDREAILRGIYHDLLL
jgi:spermidine synthase